MRTRWLYLAMGTMSLMLGSAATVEAQPPVNYNYLRAYQHFAGSRYSYRVLYSSVPGSGSATVAPFFYQSQYIEPAFSRQRIMPHGYSRFDVIPGSGGTTMTPFGFSTYYVPGFTSGFYVPHRW
ncbi:MAG TPA: hypothetical protein VMG10_17340 [Gemmataceae bacterium]|nr:hypothetical protein [Gemmataceae bacterium]